VKPRVVLILAALVAALAAFIWFVERDLPSSEERLERGRKVLPVETDEVTAVVLEWGGETVRLERLPGPDSEGTGAGDGDEGGGELGASFDWRLTAPLAGRADRALVESLLAALTGLEKGRTLEDAERSEVGLEPPRGRVTLVSADGERTLEVGAEVPASGNVLVALVGEPEVWVTPRSFTAQLEREPGEWRSREILAVTQDRISRLRLWRAGAEAPVVLVRREGGRFHLEEPFADLAAPERVEQALSDLVTLRAQRFLDGGQGGTPEPAELGLEPPRALVEIEVEGGEAIRVELGAPVDPGAGAGPDPGAEAPGGAIYARVGGQLFEAVTDLDEAAARPAEEWRSPAWTDLRSYEVDRVEVAVPGDPELVLVREGVDWRRGEETVSYTAASDLLFALTGAEGELAPATEGASSPAAEGASSRAAEVPQDEPVLTVRLVTGEGGEETLTLYPERDGSFPARSTVRSATVLLPAEAVAEVREALEAARTAEPVGAE
jgi:hypothetical protein